MEWIIEELLEVPADLMGEFDSRPPLDRYTIRGRYRHRLRSLHVTRAADGEVRRISVSLMADDQSLGDSGHDYIALVMARFYH
jgi:hypothetical protein